MKLLYKYIEFLNNINFRRYNLQWIKDIIPTSLLYSKHHNESKSKKSLKRIIRKALKNVFLKNCQNQEIENQSDNVLPC